MKAGKFAGVVAAAALLGAALAGAAHAGEGLPKGGYAGASIGHGIFNFWDDEVEDCASRAACRTDDEEIVYTVYGGFEVLPHVAIEAGLFSHEALEIDYTPTICLDGSASRLEFSAWSVYAAAVGWMPMDTGRIRPFGKAGVYRWQLEDKLTCGSGAFARTIKDDDVSPLLGVGVDVELTERVNLRTEWTWFTENQGGTYVFLGGLNFRF